MKPGGVLTAVAYVVCWTTVGAAAQDDRFPFTVEEASPHESLEHRLTAMALGVRDAKGHCDRWLVDLLVSIEDRLVRVSSSVSSRPAPIAVKGILGRQSVLVVRCAGREGYSLHGPFEWQAANGLWWLDYRARRTVRVSSGADGFSSSSLSLILNQEGHAEPWPRCRMRTLQDLECMGVPLDASAVAVSRGTGPVAWALVPQARVSVQRVATQASGWGRLLRLVDVTASSPKDLLVQAWRHVPAATAAGRARVRLAEDSTVRIYPIGPLAMWITGHESVSRRFIEVRGTDIVTVRIDVGEFQQGRADHSHSVYLRPDLPVEGTILDSQDHRVAGALVSAFEFVAGHRADDKRRLDLPLQRRWIAESVSDAQGSFSMSGLGAGSYEFLVAHSSSGRLVQTHRVSGLPLVLRLEGTPKVSGRVLVDQLPATGVQVRVVPDRDGLLVSDDPLALLAPPGITDLDGRFELALPGTWGGEVVVGGNGLAKSRFRLEGSDDRSSDTDLGDILLPGPLSVVVRLIAPGCDLMAAGPLGSLGVDMVRGRFDSPSGAYLLRLPEPGFWWVEAECGTESRAVIPPVMQIGQDDRSRVIELTLAPPAAP